MCGKVNIKKDEKENTLEWGLRNASSKKVPRCHKWYALNKTVNCCLDNCLPLQTYKLSGTSNVDQSHSNQVMNRFHHFTPKPTYKASKAISTSRAFKQLCTNRQNSSFFKQWKINYTNGSTFQKK